MKDLILRLREHGSETEVEAAAEIEQLRSSLKTIVDAGMVRRVPLIRVPKIEMLRDVETKWLTAELGRSIANLGYPVGMGVAPHHDTLMKAATTLFDRYAKMIELASANG